MTLAERVRQLASVHPDSVAIIEVSEGGSERTLTWAGLDERSTVAAHLLARSRVDHRSMVAIALANSIEFFIFSVGAWKLAACVLPLNPSMPPAEYRRILALAEPRAVVGTEWTDSMTVAAEEVWASDAAGPEHEARVPDPGHAIASAGTTGAPKLIVLRGPHRYRIDSVPVTPITGLRPRMVQLVTGPLYHNSPFGNAMSGLFYDHSLVVMRKFDARLAVELVERHRVSFMATVPTVMKRMLDAPDANRERLRSLEALLHTGAPCPPSVKQAWIDAIGSERVYEVFGGSEGNGVTAIRGDEWLQHRGSVGRPWNAVLRILDPKGNPVPANVAGEIFMRPASERPAFEYVGASARTTADGLVSLGDLGWLDESGYLYLADRSGDLILTGGANVYPAEVEAAIIEHPAVADVAVIGVADGEWGQRVHALVQLKAGAGATGADSIREWCKQRLAPHKVPKSIEFVVSLPRSEAGKLRRRQLQAGPEPAV